MVPIKTFQLWRLHKNYLVGFVQNALFFFDGVDNLTSHKTLDMTVSSTSRKRLVRTELKSTSFHVLLLQVYKKKIPLRGTVPK